MIVSSDSQNGVTIVSISGRADGDSAPDLEDEFFSMIRDGSVRMLLDCSDMSYISSAGMRVFLLAAKRCQRAGGFLTIASLRPSCRSIIEMGGFNRLIDCYDSRAEALAANA